MKTTMKNLVTALLFITLFAACNDMEFTLPPVGEPIPHGYNERKTLDEVLAQSSSKLFYQAFQASTIDSILTGSYEYTLLVPTDAAMEQAGFTSNVIAGMGQEEIDNIVKYLIIRGTITKDQLATKIGNRTGVSMLSLKNYRSLYYYGNATGSTGYDDYYYRHYIQTEGDRLLLNAEPSGNVAEAVQAKNGYVWFIDRIPEKPQEKSFLEVVQEDPRFSIFSQIRVKGDSMYLAEYRDALRRLFNRTSTVVWPNSRRTDYATSNRGSNVIITGSGSAKSVIFYSMFAPTNDAFKAAGFNSMEEILAWNKKYMGAIIPASNNVEDFGLPTDTIISYHWDYGRHNLPYNGTYGKTATPFEAVFYSNDLRNDHLENYVLNYYVNRLSYKMPFTFGKTADGKVTVKLKNSNYPEAKIIETIHTIMGPIHVVDRLFIPKDFKMQ